MDLGKLALPQSRIDAALYFIGIAGTGMAAAAGYFREFGFAVFGSDNAVYPPVSDMLEEAGIAFFEGYSASHLIDVNPYMVVIGNRIAEDNPEVEYAISNNIPYTSFPQLIGDTVLKDRSSVVVAGTHGKTTTTALLSHLLTTLNKDPSYLVGGVPLNTSRSFRVGKGELFCVEGDEYGSAFFSQGAKFLFYRPKYLLLNAIELDHVDVYRDVQELLDQFARLIAMVEDPARIVANIDCPNVATLLEQHEIKCITVSPYKRNEMADVIVLNHPPRSRRLEVQLRAFGKLHLSTSLFGAHNAANMAMALGGLIALDCKNLPSIKYGFASFKGVKKRLQHLFKQSGIDCYEDFAHHPTAVQSVLTALREKHPDRRLIAVFDCKSASSKRNIFFADYVRSLGLADLVALRRCDVDPRIRVAERMDTMALASEMGEKAHACSDDEDLRHWLESKLQRDDVLMLMSCASYGDLPQHLRQRAKKLANKKARSGDHHGFVG